MSDRMLEAPPAWLMPFVLLNLRELDSYGYELVQKMADFGFSGAKRPEAIYRALRQMEKDGMVASERDGSDGKRSQRSYSITESGKAYLEFWANSLARYQEEIDLFLKIYSGRSA